MSHVSHTNNALVILYESTGKLLPTICFQQTATPVTHCNSLQHPATSVQVNCCQRLVDNKVWEDVSSGVPDCFCRDVLVNSRYKTAAVCNLRQVRLCASVEAV